MGGRGEGLAGAWLGRGVRCLLQLGRCWLPWDEPLPPLREQQALKHGGTAACDVKPALSWCREGSCCFTEGLGAIRPMGC